MAQEQFGSWKEGKMSDSDVNDLVDELECNGGIDELFETGSRTVEINGKSYVLTLGIEVSHG